MSDKIGQYEYPDFAVTPITQEERPTAATPVELLRIAVSQGADIDKLEKLMALQERWEKNEARKAYVVAMNKFKASPPIISKNKQVTFGQTTYSHATLDHVCEEVTKGLSAVGITHDWKMKQAADLITVICVLTHELGHSEETQLEGIADKSGSKNAIQAVGSTVTYLQRYTLLSACGLAARNDDDGKGAGTPVVPTEELEKAIKEIEEAKTADSLKFLFQAAWNKASELNDRKAMAHYIQVKDKRKKELNNATR